MSTPFVKGKKKREQLRLPTLHFVAADDWMDQLGHEVFCTWLKFHTWVDRKDQEREYDKIPMSLEASWEKLDVSKSKFYRLIKPMWEFGLIDIVEYEESKRTGQKPKNIIVYEYPLHDETRMFKPLEKIRDWKKDYDSLSKEVGRTGGRPKKHKDEDFEEQPQDPEQKKGRRAVLDHRFKIETVHRFKIKTVTVSKLKPNNVLNNLINYQITPINGQKENLSIQKEIQELQIPVSTMKILKNKIDRLILLNINLDDISLMYQTNKQKIDDAGFNHVISDCLDVDHIKKTFKGLVHSTIEIYLKNKNKKIESGQAPKREVPDYLKQSSYQETDADRLNFDDDAAQKQKERYAVLTTLDRDLTPEEASFVFVYELEHGRNAG